MSLVRHRRPLVYSGLRRSTGNRAIGASRWRSPLWVHARSRCRWVRPPRSTIARRPTRCPSSVATGSCTTSRRGSARGILCRSRRGCQRRQGTLSRPSRPGSRPRTKPWSCFSFGNDYDPNIERACPVGAAIRARQWYLMRLLLAWGAAHLRVALEALCESELLERILALGVDFTATTSLATCSPNTPATSRSSELAKRHRAHDPRIQRELNMALGHHAGRDGSERVLLCLWAGNPHARAPSLRYQAIPTTTRMWDQLPLKKPATWAMSASLRR